MKHHHTLEELRVDLHRHADDVHDTGLPDRTHAVRTRVVRIRRRRAVAAAVAAVLVLGGGVGVLQLRSASPPSAAGRLVAGVPVPRTVHLLGFPYVAVQVEELGAGDSLDVQAGDAVVLVGTGLGRGSVTLLSSDGDQQRPLARVSGDEQRAAPVPVGPQDASLSVHLNGTGGRTHTGVAVYRPTDELAPGTANVDGTAVFRDQVAGEPLLAAGFTRPGQRNLDLQVPATSGLSRMSFWCAGDADLWVSASVDGVYLTGTQCDGPSRDPGLDSQVGGLPSTQISGRDLHVYLSRTPTGTEVAPPPGVTFGAGVYPSTPTRRVGDLGAVARQIDADGRTWVLDQVVTPPATVDTSAGDRYAVLQGIGDPAQVSWTGRLSSGSGQVGSRRDPASVALGTLLAGDRYHLTMTQGQRTVVAVYRPE